MFESDSIQPNPDRLVLRVVEVISMCNAVFGQMEFSVEGEVANYNVSKGKFVFFDLKDEQEDARIACFAMTYQLSSPLEDGMRVVVTGKPGLYQKSGQFRLSVLKAEPVGEGSLKRAFELLKKKLELEGLFSPVRKRKLPRYVNKVGIISSSEAAGFGDFYRIAWQRLPGVAYYLANVSVQGVDAEKEIITAFDHLNENYDLDAIVLIRGGGSMEDLHAFNSELVARAIVRSKAPVIVGVGHEKDVTIADFCSDVRAATPSNAAQILLPTKEETLAYAERLTSQGQRTVEQRIKIINEKNQNRVSRFYQILQYVVSQKRGQVDSLIKLISSLSPQTVLARGYTITTDLNGTVIKSVKGVETSSTIVTRFLDGKVISLVSKKDD